MTVKCLDEHTKNFIAAAYREGIYDSAELAEMNDVSKRTINRVCVELGVNKLRVHRPRTQLELPMRTKPYNAQESHDIQIPEVPAPVVTPTPPQRSFKDAILDFIAKTILHFKK